MHDWADDPQVALWLAEAAAKLVPSIASTVATISVVPESPDPKFAIELGYSIMLDKPLVLLVYPGQQVPAKLVEVADEILELDVDQPLAGEVLTAAAVRLHAAVRRAVIRREDTT